METLRILWLNHRDPKHPQAGGSEVHLWEVSKRLALYGHEVTILSEKFKGASEHEKLNDVNIYRAGGKVSVYPHAFLRYLRRFKGKCDLVVDDIAHAVPWFTPLYVKKPIVAIVHHVHHEILDLELPFPLSRFARIAEQSIPNIYRDASFITVSESTKNELVKMRIPPEKVRVTHLGIDHDCYKPDWENKSSFPFVLCLGRIKRYKNIDHVIEAMNLVAKEVPDVKFIIAGKGDEDVAKSLEGLIRDLCLGSIIEFRKDVSEEEKVRLLQEAWICVTASRKEGWGITAIEAAACGTPTIAYDVEGLRDSIKNGETGLLAPYGDTKCLANLTIRIITDSSLRNRLSKNAANWSKRFSWDETAKQTLELFMAAAHS
ncbi:glycosyltransferase family 4 protein [Candidatus Bathyarchaeota archaeon]|nr:glycosyltransferase family 4 protein [Candidatus Bathyarchaeota archaeon]